MTTHPNKTRPSTTTTTKRKLNLWIDIALVILFTFTILSLITGEQRSGEHIWGAVHCIAGNLMFVGCLFHLVLHKRWIKAMILKMPKNLTPLARRNRRLFFGSLASLVACGVSGLASLPPFSHGPGLHLWHGLHGLSGVIFLGLSIYHLVLHETWIKTSITPSKV